MAKLTPADIHEDHLALSNLINKLPITGTFSIASLGGGYSRVLTEFGNLTVSIKDIQPIGDGQKVIFKIGNPTYAVLQNLTIQVYWNRSKPDSDSALSSWWEKMRMEKFNPAAELAAGKVTEVPVILPSTKAEELGHIQINLSVGGVLMF